MSVAEKGPGILELRGVLHEVTLTSSNRHGDIWPMTLLVVEGSGKEAMALLDLEDVRAIAQFIAEWFAEMGICPTDGEPLPCMTCGAGT